MPVGGVRGTQDESDAEWLDMALAPAVRQIR